MWALRSRSRTLTTTIKLAYVLALPIVAVVSPQIAAQVHTEVPPIVAGAKPITVEHIKIHGAALEGNLESNAVDRDVCLSPSKLPQAEIPGAIRLCMRCTAIRSELDNGLRRSLYHKQLNAPSLKVPEK